MGLFKGNKKTEEDKKKTGGEKKEESKKENVKTAAKPKTGGSGDISKKGVANKGKSSDPSPKTSDKGKKDTKALNAYKVLVKPLITEKATDLGSLSKYVFAVDPKANKIEISKAIQEVYGVKPIKVNLIKMKGKTVTRGRYTGRRKDWKKAVITLPKGKTIQVYEGI